MKLNYIISESTERPDLIDDYSSKYVTYLRRNVSSKFGDEGLMYVYEEAQLTKAEYQKYLKELEIIDIQQQRADIDYMAMMLGITL